MKQAEKELLQYIRYALFRQAPEISQETDFAALLKEADAQCVTPLLYDCLGKLGVEITPPELKGRTWKKVGMCLANNQKLRYAQREACSLLEQAGIPCVILKGTSAAANYPAPDLRMLGDIDVLVHSHQQWDAVRCLQNAGYGNVEDEAHHCHFTIARKGLQIEVHKEPNGLFLCQDPLVERQLRSFFQDAVEKRQWCENEPVLSDGHLAVLLLLHKLEHFISGGLGLRQLCDWAMFVDKRMTPALWQELVPQLDRFGLKIFARTVTRVCVDFLGLPSEKAPWCMVAEAALAEAVMEDVLRKGNFGQKENAQVYGSALFGNLESESAAGSFRKALVAACKRSWKPCEKYPVLVPLAIPKVLLRHRKMRKSGQRAAFRPVKAVKLAKQRRTLVKSLKPFINDEKKRS